MVRFIQRIPARKLLLAWAVICSPLTNAEDRDWGDLVRKDTQASYHWIKENHPGSIDDDNPEFRKILEKGYRTATEKSKLVKDLEGYRAVLSEFFAGFHDGHLGFRINSDIPEAKVYWPGIVLGYRNGRAVVVYRENSKEFGVTPPMGSELLSCDGKSLSQLIEENVQPYDSTASTVAEAVLTRLTPMVLLDQDNPFVDRIQQCLFSLKGQEQIWDIKWVATPQKVIEPKMDLARNIYSPSMSIHPMDENAFWISVPTFSAQNDESLAALNKLIADLNASTEEMRKAQIIVVDVRGNHGGNSSWGNAIIRALWGDEMFDTYRPKSEGIKWRVSIDTYRYLSEDLLPMIKNQFGESSPEYVEFKNEIDGFKEALDRGDLWFNPYERGVRPETEKPENPVKANVYFLTDPACFSSCLLFADRMRLLPNVVQIGLATRADTKYGEVRSESLPSGLATMMGPQKIFLGRLRTDNEPYVPKFRWSGEMSDQVGLERWVLDLDRQSNL
ncbi:MAG: S41 family peptidase [Oligoflexales bacterium]